MFVSTNPEKDTPRDLKKYRDSMFGKDLLIARTDSSDDKNFLEMLKNFKVPVGQNEEEKAKMREFFKQRDAKNNATFLKRIYSKLAFWSEERVFNSMDEAADGLLN